MKQTTNTTQKRLKILGDDEIFAIYQRPHFTHEERIEYFSISPKELAAMEQLHSIKSRIYYILQLESLNSATIGSVIQNNGKNWNPKLSRLLLFVANRSISSVN